MFHFKMTSNVVIKDLYRVDFSGSRKSIYVCANSFGQAVSIGNRVCLHDDISTSVTSVQWIDSIALFD